MRLLLITMIVAFAMLPAGGCASGTRYVIVGGAQAPSVAGTLTLSSDEQSSDVELTLEFVSPPESLGNGLKHYVAWALSEGRGATRLAPLSYVPEARTASVLAAGPALPYTLLVTAEATTAPAEPSETVVLQKQLDVD